MRMDVSKGDGGLEAKIQLLTNVTIQFSGQRENFDCWQTKY